MAIVFEGLVAVLSAGVVRLVDSGCLQMAGDMRGCFRGVGRSCRPLLKPQAPAATSESVVGLELSPSMLLTRESR
jgi:hypothetical protein